MRVCTTPTWSRPACTQPVIPLGRIGKATRYQSTSQRAVSLRASTPSTVAAPFTVRGPKDAKARRPGERKATARRGTRAAYATRPLPSRSTNPERQRGCVATRRAGVEPASLDRVCLSPEPPQPDNPARTTETPMTASFTCLLSSKHGWISTRQATSAPEATLDFDEGSPRAASTSACARGCDRLFPAPGERPPLRDRADGLPELRRHPGYQASAPSRRLGAERRNGRT